MTPKEALKAMCEDCQRAIQAQPSKGDLPHRECPFRHISNDYCEEYDIVKEALDKGEKQAEILLYIKGCYSEASGWIGGIDTKEDQSDDDDEKRKKKLIRSWLEEKQ